MAGDVERNPGPRTICDSCSKAIRHDYLQSELTCSIEGCQARCHQALRCSKIGRYRKKENWMCRLHSTTDTNNPNPNPPPSSSTSAEPNPPTEKRSCGKKGCKIGIRTNPFRCCNCERYFHQGCSGVTSRIVRQQFLDGAPWTCADCEKRANQTPASVPDFIEETPESGKINGVTKKSLRIMQWNADTVSEKS